MDARKSSGEFAEEIEVRVELPAILAEHPEFFTPRNEPFHGDPVGDARRVAFLDLVTKRTKEGSSTVDIVSPRETPKEWLQRLTTVDFSDSSAISNHALDLVINNVVDFDLVTNGEPAFTVSPFPGVLTVDNTPPKEEVAIFSSHVPSDHTGLFCLEFTSKTGILAVGDYGKTLKPSTAGLPLPSVVLPIGRLQSRYTDKTGISYSVDTDYVLVVDAIADAHPLWLMFDRNIGSLEEGRAYIRPETTKLVFSRTEKNFDAAQVLPSLQDWIQSYGTLDFTQIRDSFQQTGITGAIRARNVTFSDLPASWTRVTPIHEHK